MLVRVKAIKPSMFGHVKLLNKIIKIFTASKIFIIW